MFAVLINDSFDCWRKSERERERLTQFIITKHNMKTVIQF